jgi:hypothetical protein
MHVDSAEALGLLLHGGDEIGPVDSLGKSREILDFGSERKLASGLMSDNHQRGQTGVAGYTGIDRD